jgi:hypothetical protein
MTDARLKGEWLTAAAHDGLSDPAYRVLHNALMHSAEQGTDGVITARQLRFLYPGTLKIEWLEELIDAGFLERTSDGYLLLGWSTTLGQSTAADVEAYRAKNRERQRKHRERQRQSTDGAPTEPTDSDETRPGGPRYADATIPTLRLDPSRSDNTRDVTRDETVNVGQARRGEDRPSPRLSEKRRTRPRSHDCGRDGHVMDAAGITCLKCEYRDVDRQYEASMFGASA